MRIKRLLAIGLSIGIIASMLLSASGVYAAPIVQVQKPIANLQVSKTANNNYTIQIGANSIPLGSATTSFTPKMVFPDWQGYAWNAQLGLTMAVTGNALAVAGMTSSSTSTSVTASNSYFSITYSGVNINPPFNETGGLDMSINILKNIGTTLAFGYNSTNVNAYLQPPLTAEWTVGQLLPNGNTVSSVTATTVTDNQGNIIAFRPIYVVGSLCLMSSVGGGMVSTAQAATGYTTGEIGMLYALKCQDSSSTPQTGYATWSISGSSFILTLPVFTNPVYPITLAPAGDTFGYTTAGSTSQLMQTDILYAGYPFPSTSNAGTATAIQFYGNRFGSTPHVQLGIYTDGATSSYVGNTGVITLNSATTQWWSANISSGGTISANTTYDLGWNGDYYINIFYSSISNYNRESYAVSYGTWPSSVTWTSRPFSSNTEFSIYCTYTAGGGVSITNSPSSLAFGTVMPGTIYYANGMAYSNPVTSGQCTFTITNTGGGSVNLGLTCTNATGGNTWTLVSGSPSGDQFKVIAVYLGENPASGLVLTTSNQSFYSGLAASGTLKWDFEEILGGTGSGKSGTFSDSSTKTYTITITGS